MATFAIPPRQGVDNREIIIELDYGLPSALSPNGRAHWRKKATVQKEFKESVYYRAREYNLDNPIDPATVHYHYRWCGSRPDQDNFIASMKHALDGLVAAEIIVDDDPSHVTGIDVTYERVRHRSEVGIMITVRPDTKHE